MASYYDIMQVCKNGHRINDYSNSMPEYNKDFCDECGSETITKCLDCDSSIRGHHHVDGVVGFFGTPVPKFCHNCGKPYPWSSKKEKIKMATSKKVTNPLILVENMCNRFHLIVRQIKDRYDNRPTLDINDEYDVQNLLHSLLKVHFDDIRDEEWTPSYAGGCSRVDFLLKQEKIIIEVKKTRSNLRDKELGEQLIIDIAKYKIHPDCKTLVCFVYDPDGHINKPKAIENDLSKQNEDLKVITIIVPKGY